MRRIFTLVTVLLVLLSLSPGTMNARIDADLPHVSGDYVAGELLLKFHQPIDAGLAQSTTPPQVGLASVDAGLRRLNAQSIEPLFPDVAANDAGLERIYRLTLPSEANVLAAVAMLAGDVGIEYAEPNYVFHIATPLRQSGVTAIPSDPGFGFMWGLNNTGQGGGTPDIDINAPEAWDISVGSRDVLVAVVDTGIDYTHPELDDGRVRTDIDRDFINNDFDAFDDNQHGTHVAGTIAAETNNGAGVAGVMWEAELLPIKVFTAQGVGSTTTLAQGIGYAAYVGADVINLSLGGLICTQVVADAVNYAYFERDAVLVAATGNNNGAVSYPARLDPVIAVAALDASGSRAGFSNYGPEVDVSAPGVDVLSTVPGGSYASFNGTSMATPHVAGVVGLLLAQRPDLNNDQVREILRSTARDRGLPGYDPFHGYGQVDALGVLQAPTPTNPPPAVPVVCDGCAVSVAMLDAESREDVLQVLWQLQDNVLTSSSIGSEFTELFYRHSAEVSLMLLNDADLRATVQVQLADLLPIARALNGEGPDVPIAAEQIERIRALVDTLSAVASPALQQDLAAFWQQVEPERFAGMTARTAWATLQNSDQVYLPLVVTQ